jgi:hypothetical protein
MSDHMLTVEWTKEGGWAAPKIIPYQNLSISPAASCLHYGEYPHVDRARGNPCTLPHRVRRQVFNVSRE